MKTVKSEAAKLDIVSFKMCSGAEIIASIHRNEPTEAVIVVEVPLQLVLDRTSNGSDQYLLREWASHAFNGIVAVTRSNIEAFFKCDERLKEMYLETIILIAQSQIVEEEVIDTIPCDSHTVH